MTTRPPETRSPAAGNGEAIFRKQHNFYIVAGNSNLRQRWRPVAPAKTRIRVSAELEAILHEMAKGGAR